MKDATLRFLLDARADGQAVVLATDLTTGEEELIHPFATRSENETELVEAARDAALADRSRTLETEAGYDVTVVDPRAAFATEERFPGIGLMRTWPKEGLAELGLDRRTALVTVTHDPKLDDPALQAALGSDVFYIGALGSRRTHRARVKRLKEAGLTEADVGRIHAPVGLDLGARTPGEIAASVVAEIIQVLRAGAG